METNKKQGFTLIELLVVISIISLLSSVILASLNSARSKARDAVRKSSLKQVQTALELYYNTNNSYPSTGGSWQGECSLNGGITPSANANLVIPGLAPNYITAVPHDPNTNIANTGNATCSAFPNSSTYSCYLYRSDAVDYKLLAHCLPENNVQSSSGPFLDPQRPNYTWAIGTPNGLANW